MHRTYLVNDLRKNRAMTAVIALFILLAALLTATAGGTFAQRVLFMKDGPIASEMRFPKKA